MEDQAVVAQAPYMVEVEEGKTYFWCSCDSSDKQPFCDGSHKTTFLPMKFEAEKSQQMYFADVNKLISNPFAMGRIRSFKEALGE